MAFEDQDQNSQAQEAGATQDAPDTDDAQNDGPRGDGAAAVQELNQKLAEAQQQAAEYLDQARRSAAELSNARKRMQREQAEQAAKANARLLEKLIPIIDDVDRAFAALPADEASNEWVNGFRLIQRKLQNLLESEGVRVIEAEGEKFDPAFHYAVSHEEAEGFGEGEVIGVVAKGYRLGDTVLRPAMVRVAKGNA